VAKAADARDGVGRCYFSRGGRRANARRRLGKSGDPARGVIDVVHVGGSDLRQRRVPTAMRSLWRFARLLEARREGQAMRGLIGQQELAEPRLVDRDAAGALPDGRRRSPHSLRVDELRMGCVTVSARGSWRLKQDLQSPKGK